MTSFFSIILYCLKHALLSSGHRPQSSRIFPRNRQQILYFSDELYFVSNLFALFILLALCGVSSPANAQSWCSSNGQGTTTCNGSPSPDAGDPAILTPGDTILFVTATNQISPNLGYAAGIIATGQGISSSNTGTNIGSLGPSLQVSYSNTYYLSPSVGNNQETAGISTIGVPGIYIQSLGGAGDWGSSHDFGSGSDGGWGGSGGDVNYYSNTSSGIYTQPVIYPSYAYQNIDGIPNHAIFAMSKGGDGGKGGEGGVFGEGGPGGGGGSGGKVTVYNASNLFITNPEVAGIWTQSIGGNGGSGGDGRDVCVFDCGGGAGAAGGAGDNITVTNYGSISLDPTFLANFYPIQQTTNFGIFAQSVGGFSGNGGAAYGLFYSFGGSNQNAGPGGTVSVTNYAAISLSSINSFGIHAQSVGGGGGAGGSGLGLIGFGGSGGQGGSGGAVSLINSGALNLSGSGSYGIYAQSVGGGGGTAGGAIGGIGKGGNGGSASNGGSVTVTNTGNISSTKSSVFAQSIGGSGGDGGDSAGLISIGGEGASGGNGGNVAVNNGGNLSTTDKRSAAIYAQSVGGGGGSGGSADAVSVVPVSIGGTGSGGGNGGSVSVDNTNASMASPIISTQGSRSAGIFAHSIGGGGGDGGGSVSVGAGSGALSFALGASGGTGGTGGAVTALSDGQITTMGDHSAGINALSLGGGGGAGGYAIALAGGYEYPGLALSIGGSGGGGGSASSVTINNTSVLQTLGAYSQGLVARSIGGGGGNGGYSISAAGSPIASIALALGGSGGSGGAGGVVNLINNASIATGSSGCSGCDFSSAIDAKSLGGGGGDGGFTIAAAGAVNGSLTLSNGGPGGAGNKAGAVSVAHASYTGQGISITTYGAQSNGIRAQSIGGGGGDGGYSIGAGVGGDATLGLTVAGNGNSGASGAAVTIQSDGNITTYGANSTGILGRSLGGGGGSGGFAVGASVSGKASLTASLGGSGGSGGNSDDVIITAGSSATPNQYAVVAGGANSHGVAGVSLGGAGGDAGFAVSGGIGGDASLTATLGGSGGQASQSGVVNITNYQMITTYGVNSNAIYAKSQAGGGGDGGFAIGGSISGKASATFNMGGSGGSGNDANNVLVSNFGNLGTISHSSNGIFAQSLGGGGGNAGFAGGGAAALSMANSTGSFSTNIGGKAGSGGSGGDVAVCVGNAGSLLGGAPTCNGGTASTGGYIATKGSHSSAIYASSIGGGGGVGGYAIGVSASQQLTTTLNLGGSGGNGGYSGDVSVNSLFAIQTGWNFSTSKYFSAQDGNQSYGIYAQSLGGGGGTGGWAGGINLQAAASSQPASLSANIAIGGDGGTGGNAGGVTVTQIGNITTAFNNSDAIHAVSQGGGGGDGGYSFAGSATAWSGDPDNPSTNVNATLAIGGKGANAGTGGDVSVSNLGSITTTGANSSAIYAQSLGGGGGSGGLAVSAPLTITNGNSVSAGVSLGGDGGGGNTAGNVSVTSVGYNSFSIPQSPPIGTTSISTAGSNSDGIFAQSVGGGGGTGGLSITINSSATTNGKFQIGGAVSDGGNAGAGSDAGTVEVNNYQNITTIGNSSYGIFAQSIGGGGGKGGGSISIGAQGNAGYNQIGGVTGDVSLGGSGGLGGNGNDVTVNSGGTIATNGAFASAIKAQSVGGGGGDGGFTFSGSATFTNTTGAENSGQLAANVALGGSGGAAGDGGIVNVVSYPMGNWGVLTVPQITLTTIGDYSDGIHAQSIGGGGGTGGWSASGSLSYMAVAGPDQNVNVGVSIGGSGGSGGNGGAASVINYNNTKTIGDHSDGIAVQSIGGGGGDGGLSVGASLGSAGTKNVSLAIGGSGGGGGNANTVSVTNYGNIFTGSQESVTQQLAEPGTVTQSGFMYTGKDANAIIAQSIGGGGGNGGLAITGGFGLMSLNNTTYQVGVSVGGSGGVGGTGESVTVTNAGVLGTYGDGASGIKAQSIGGGGGNGGMAFSGLIAAGNNQQGAQSIQASASVGGSGGSGNTSGIVTIVNSGNISTHNATAYGILAQSIGGGGGEGGNANTFNLQLASSCEATSKVNPIANLQRYVIKNCTAAPKPSYDVQVNVGGAGGAGNDGNKISISNSGNIFTKGDTSVGILAQSIGGGGGNGGQAIVGLTGLFPYASKLGDATILLPNKASGPSSKNPLSYAKVSVGGSGGASGDGAEVTITNQYSSINTSGVAAAGIMAQSIGAGGGNGGGGSSGLKGALSIGGAGGGQGNGGDVTVTNFGEIITNGDKSEAILAQSVGGGGGNIANLEQLDNAGSGNSGGGGGILSVALGGASAGDGGVVTITNSGALQTSGDQSAAIMAQSIGGGGGSGGVNDHPVLSLGSTGAGGGGNGGQISITNNGWIKTNGEASHGIFAQSIGGGGGAATVANYFNQIQTGSMTIGGGAGNGGAGGDVQVINNNNIYVQRAIGILAQSIGGGGGATWNYLKFSPTIPDIGSSLSFTLGDTTTSAGSAGGHVKIENTSNVAATYVAVVAQSVGSGGGLINFGGSSSSYNVDLSVGSANNAGAVSVNNTGQIETAGNNSVAVIAQSLNGGGLALLNSIAEDQSVNGVTSINFQGVSSSSASCNLASNIPACAYVNNAGTIFAGGNSSVGVFAQSGAGGAIVSNANDYSFQNGHTGSIAMSNEGPGSASIINTGQIMASGQNSTAIVAQAASAGFLSNDGSGTVTIKNGTRSNEGLIYGGNKNGAGISIISDVWGGGNIENYGKISQSGGASGTAIYSTAGANRIDNWGIIRGNIDLSQDSGGVINLQPKSIWSTSSESENLTIVNNGGTISIGGTGSVASMTIHHDYRSPSNSVHAITTDLDPVSDRLNIMGTANMSGAIVVDIKDPGAALPGSQSHVIVHSRDGLSNNGLRLATPQSAVIAFDLTNDANNLYLNYFVNFSPIGMTKNQNNLGNAINGIQLFQQGPLFPAFKPIASALLYQPNVWALGQAYNSLSGEGVTATQQSNFTAIDNFISSAMTQSNLWLIGREEGSANSIALCDDKLKKDPSAPTSEYIYRGIGRLAPRICERTWSAWFLGSGSAFSYNGDPSNLGTASVNLGGGGFSGGIDRQITADALLGFTAGYGRYGFGVSDRRTSGNVYGGHIASYGAIRNGDLYGRGIVGLDFFTNNETRSINISGAAPISADDELIAPIPGIYANPFGQFGSNAVSGRFEMGYRKSVGSNFDVTSFAALQFSSLRSQGFNENSIYGLNFSGRNALSLPSFLGGQVDGRFRLTAGNIVNAWVRAAWRHEFNATRSVMADFLAAPGMYFDVNGTKVPRNMARINAGIEVGLSGNISLFSVFNSDLAANGQSYGGSGGVRYVW